MFERYNPTARRAIFFARYEVSQLGGSEIDTQHLLLGILREDRALASRLLKSYAAVESIRKKAEEASPRREKVATSVDIPMSRQSKRVMAHGAKEATRLKHEHIGVEHLLLGMFREKNCAAAKILGDAGVTVADVEREAERSLPGAPPREFAAAPAASESQSGFRDLTAAARDGLLGPLVGRERELESLIQILSRRTRNNAVLVGESGVGKNTIVHGLAQRIADGLAPAHLAGRRILAIDAATLIGLRHPPRFSGENIIVYAHGLFDLAGAASGSSALAAMQLLDMYLAEGLQWIATGTPLGLRLTVERAGPLARLFEPVSVLPPSEDEAIRILTGIKEQYEKFHGVAITDEAIDTAISASRWFVRHRQLPDRAIDLIDEASVRVKLRRTGEPPEVAEIERRLKLIVRQMESAIANHDFTKARFFSDEERREREALREARTKAEPAPRSDSVTADDVVEATAARAGVAVAAVRNMLSVKRVDRLAAAARELVWQLSAGSESLADQLAAYLAGCSAEELERLLQAIRAAKGRLAGP